MARPPRRRIPIPPGTGGASGSARIPRAQLDASRPQVPLCFHGARVREIYPMVLLMEGMGIGIAATSYAGAMNFGSNADPDLVPNVDLFAEMMQRSLERIAKEAGVELSWQRSEEAPE